MVSCLRLNTANKVYMVKQKQKQEGDRKALRREIRSVKHRVAISTDQKKTAG